MSNTHTQTHKEDTFTMVTLSLASLVAIIVMLVGIYFLKNAHFTTVQLVDLVEYNNNQHNNLTIHLDIRYAGYHNFVGRPITGYLAPKCLLTKQAAQRVLQAQIYLEEKYGMTFKIYDCYRPQQAVDDFVLWSKGAGAPSRDMRDEFFPTFSNRTELFEKGFIAFKSGHSRGSTIDLTIVPLPVPQQQIYTNSTPLVSCTEEVGNRFRDNSIDMGTGFDCFDTKSHTDPSPSGHRLTPEQINNRKLLVDTMAKYGFQNYAEEWWHYTMINEPYPNTYLNQPIV